MRSWFRVCFLGFLTIVLALGELAAAQSAPFRVRPSDIDSEVKDPSKDLKETRTPVTTPKANTSATAKDLQSIERQTAKANAPVPTRKTSNAFPKSEKDANPKINIKGSGEPKTGSSQTRVATSSYKGRLKQKAPHSNNY
jgi:hypothetical protein